MTMTMKTSALPAAAALLLALIPATVSSLGAQPAIQLPRDQPGPVPPPAAAPSTSAASAPAALTVGGFHVEDEVVVPGTPEEAFKAFTEETLAWWDHHFSPHPVKLYFDTRPGGAFWEIFDAEGHGAMHATVILADPPRTLRFTGPLGLSGNALEMVHTLTFEAAGTGTTRVKLVLNATGQMEKGWPEAVQGVWHHFLAERFKPYMEKKKSSGGVPK
jgi:hypothetical protein